MAHLLIVDDDMEAASALRAQVANAHCSVALAHSLAEARRQLALQRPDVVLLALHLPDGSGLTLFDDAELVAGSEVVLVAGHASAAMSQRALQAGAAECLSKPVAVPQLQQLLARVMGRPAALPGPPGHTSRQGQRPDQHPLAGEPDAQGRFGGLWGRAPAMRRIYQQMARVAGTGVTVFITGESGTGKEVVAQTVHAMSLRRRKPFLALNCGAISPNLFESEMFGHEKGSFTGAERQHQGYVERACGGTLFLDEITEMPMPLQVKLLRVLETGQFTRVGATQPLAADVRIMAASNRPPQQAVAQGLLREDLFYRLNVFPLALPPLRERLCDVELLARQFLQAISAEEGQPRQFTPAALGRLARWHWPGNVRELRNVVQRAYVMASGERIDETWVLPEMVAELASSAAPTAPPAMPSFTAHDPAAGEQICLPVGGCSMAQAEKALILATLRHFHHHKERTAAALGISLKTLYNRLKDYAAEEAVPAPRDAPLQV